MWNDEDNNPYGSFDRRDSNTSDPPNPGSPRNRKLTYEKYIHLGHRHINIYLGYESPLSPASDRSSPVDEPPEFVSRPRDLSDADDDVEYPARSRSIPRKKGGYDSRIEQILYENPHLQIVITEAGKSNESGGSYIVYTIRTGVLYITAEL